jgi:hypothetical protein
LDRHRQIPEKPYAGAFAMRPFLSTPVYSLTLALLFDGLITALVIRPSQSKVPPLSARQQFIEKCKAIRAGMTAHELDAHMEAHDTGRFIKESRVGSPDGDTFVKFPKKSTVTRVFWETRNAKLSDKFIEVYCDEVGTVLGKWDPERIGGYLDRKEKEFFEKAWQIEIGMTPDQVESCMAMFGPGSPTKERAERAICGGGPLVRTSVRQLNYSSKHNAGEGDYGLVVYFDQSGFVVGVGYTAFVR